MYEIFLDIYSTVKTDDTEVLGKYRAKPSKIKTIDLQALDRNIEENNCTDCKC